MELEVQQGFSTEEGHTLVTVFSSKVPFFCNGHDLVIVNFGALARPADNLPAYRFDFAHGERHGAKTTEMLEQIEQKVEELKSGVVELLVIDGAGVTYEDIMGVPMRGIHAIQWANEDLAKMVGLIKKKYSH